MTGIVKSAAEPSKIINKMLAEANISPDQVLIDTHVKLEDEYLHTVTCCAFSPGTVQLGTITLTDLRLSSNICPRNTLEEDYTIGAAGSHGGYLLDTVVGRASDMEFTYQKALKLVNSPKPPTFRAIFNSAVAPWYDPSQIMPPLKDKDSIWLKKLNEHIEAVRQLSKKFERKLAYDETFFKDVMRKQLPLVKLPQQGNDTAFFILDTNYLTDWTERRLAHSPESLTNHRAACFLARGTWGDSMSASIISVPAYAAAYFQELEIGDSLLTLKAAPTKELLEIMSTLTENDPAVPLSQLFEMATALAK